MFWNRDVKWSRILGLFGTCAQCGWETTQNSLPPVEDGPEAKRWRRIMAA